MNIMAQATITTEKIELQVSGTPPMAAYVARPADNSVHPGLLIFQEAFGVNAHIRDVTGRFARQGYTAIAPELFHRTAPPGFEASYNDFPSIKPHREALTAEALEADIGTTWEWLRSNAQIKADDISSVGFCLGGRVAYLANSVLPLRAAVSFYGGGIVPDLLARAPKLHAPMLLIWGGLDKHITADHRKTIADALTAQHKSYVNVEFSQADHGFFCDQRSAYEPRSARQAWALTLEFLRS
jgi:carboxymethylenebutenolidase